MFGRICHRLLLGAVLVFALSLVSFGLFYAMPGDAARQLLSQMMDGMPDDASTEALRTRYGLDRPLHEQYLAWLGSALSGDFGASFQTGNAVADELPRRAGASLALTAAGMLVMAVISFGLGIRAAVRAGGWFDRSVLVGSVVAMAMPNFWLGQLLLLVFALYLGLLPVGGGGPTGIVLPALVVGASLAGLSTRYVRSWVLEALRLDHVRTAYAKGAGPRRVMLRHVLPVALPALITLFGLQAVRIFDSLIVVEVVFGWPGIGSYLASGVLSRDLPVMQATLMLVGIAYVLVNILVDVTIALVDPRAAGAV